MKPIRYLKQREMTTCGVMAVLNALRFQRRPGVTRRSHFNKIREEIGHSHGRRGTRGGTWPDDLDRGVREYGFRPMRSPTWVKIMKQLFIGDGLIVHMTWLEDDDLWHGHYFLLTGVCVNAGEIRYRVVNLPISVRAADDPTNPWLTTDEIARPHCKLQRVHFPHVWIVPYNYQYNYFHKQRSMAA